MRVERSDDDPRAIAYTMKPNFGRRQSYEDDRKRPNLEKCGEADNQGLRYVKHAAHSKNFQMNGRLSSLKGGIKGKLSASLFVF